MHSHFTLSFIGASSYPLRTHPLRSYPLRASSSLRPRFLHHRSFFHRRRFLHRSVHDLITDSNCHSLVILIHRFRTCIYRKKTRRGSSAFMEKEIPFIGILSNKAEQNPELTISFPSRLVCGKMKVVKCSNPDSCKLV
ncbi:hypothetical protein S83_015299 [Arachis hypogaea]